MDHETKQNTNQQASASGGNDTTAKSHTGAQEAPKMMELLEQSSVPTGVCNWLSCLRKPGMTVSYSLEKRHISDMNAPRRDSECGRMSSDQSRNASIGASRSDGDGKKIGATDTVRCSGTCAIRYFDLAVGAALILTLCGLLKGCLGCCRCVKKKMM